MRAGNNPNLFFVDATVGLGHFSKEFTEFTLKAPYSSYFIQERFNKLIYSFNMIIKCDI